VWTKDESDTRRLTVADEAVTPAGLQVRSVLGVQGESVLFTASEEPTEIHVWSYGPDGLNRLTTEPGHNDGVRCGPRVQRKQTSRE
jgi:dipeptidyl-peptidase-4